MTQRINYSQANQSGKLLARSVSNLIEAVADFKRTAALLDALSFGSDWTSTAGELGVSQQEAQDLWTIVATLRDKTNSANAGDFAGAFSSLARLDQG